MVLDGVEIKMAMIKDVFRYGFYFPFYLNDNSMKRNELIEWCSNNIGKAYFNNRWFVQIMNSSIDTDYNFYFKEPNDAMLFMLSCA